MAKNTKGRRLLIMALLTLTYSSVKSCKPRNHFCLTHFWPALNNVSPPRVLSTTNRRAPSMGIRPIGIDAGVPAFQYRRHSSTHAADAMSPPSTSVHSTPRTKSDMITRSDPGQIFPERDYVACFAGISRGSAQNAGLGVALFDSEGSEMWWCRQQLAGVTANEAEYVSLLTCLKSARSLGVRRITAQGCNGLVFRQMEGTYKVKKPSLIGYYDSVVSLSREFASFRMRLVEKSMNERAIELARSALDTQSAESSEIDNLATSRENDGIDWGNFTPDLPSKLDIAPSIPSSLSADKTYVLRFDGGSRGNPGAAGAGMALYDGENGSEIWSGYRYLGDDNTNNEAEYVGLIVGLQCARSMGVENIVAQGDSQLVLRQVEGEYKVKTSSLKPYYKKAMSLVGEFASFRTTHIERARNERADLLANTAMDTQTSRGFNVP